MENGNEYPYNFKLIRGAKGKYRWEITVRSYQSEEVLLYTGVLDDAAKVKWGDVSE